MLPRSRRIRTAAVFGAVRRDGRSSSTHVLSLVAKLRDVDVHRKSSFGFIVSRRIGKATVRNLVKRRLRAVAQASENALVGWDIVVTARPPAATATFADLSDAMRAAIRRATNQPNSAASVDGQ